jgi:hypothetical protein
MEFMPTAPAPQQQQRAKEVKIAPIFSMMQRIKEKAAAEVTTPPADSLVTIINDEESNFEPLKFRFDDNLLMMPDDENTMAAQQVPMQAADADSSPLKISASQADALLEQSARLMDITQDSVLGDGTERLAGENQTLMSALRLEMERIRREEDGSESAAITDGLPKAKRRLIRAAEFIGNGEPAKDRTGQNNADSDGGDSGEEGSESESDGDEIDSASESLDMTAQPSVKPPNFVENEAEVEEDENMYQGGMDGDALEAEKALREELAAFIDEDDETLKGLTIEELQHRIKQNESVWRLFNEQQRESELKETKELVKDIATGKILDKRKHKINIDPSTAAELDKFGRLEDDDERNTGTLRELDDLKDYGMFGDLIGRVMAEQRKQRSTQRKRKHLAETEEDKLNGPTANWVGDGEDDNDWTNDGTAAGGVSLGPGEFIETDLDKLEERVKRRTLLQRLVRCFT